MAPLSNLAKLFSQQSILTHEVEDDWLIVEKDEGADSATYTCKANGWHMVQHTGSASTITNVHKQADLVKNVNLKPIKAHTSAEVENVARSNLSKVIEQLQTALKNAEISKRECMVAVLHKTVTQAPNKMAVEEVRRAAIENRIKAYQEMSKPHMRFESIAPFTRVDSPDNMDGLTKRTNYVEAVQKSGAVHRESGPNAFPSNALESGPLNSNVELVLPRASMPSRQPLLHPEPETIIKAIPPEGISRSDLTLKFKPFWPLDSNQFREWVHRFRAIVKTVAVYEADTRMVKQKPKCPLKFQDTEIEEEFGRFYR